MVKVKSHMRQIRQWNEDKIRGLWGSGKDLAYKGRKYKVHRMSYGTYFLEPSDYKGGETDPFSIHTIWLEFNPKTKKYFPT